MKEKDLDYLQELDRLFDSLRELRELVYYGRLTKKQARVRALNLHKGNKVLKSKIEG